jgi:hypothetical protein
MPVKAVSSGERHAHHRITIPGRAINAQVLPEMGVLERVKVGRGIKKYRKLIVSVDVSSGASAFFDNRVIGARITHPKAVAGIIVNVVAAIRVNAYDSGVTGRRGDSHQVPGTMICDTI